MKNSVSYLKKYKKQIVLGPIFKILEAIFELIIPFIVAFIIDTGIKTNDSVFVVSYGFLIVLLGVLGLLSTMVCQYFASIASQGYGTDLRNAIFKKINTVLKIDFDRLGRGYIQNLITNDINQMQVVLAMFIRLVIRAPFLVIGSLVCSFIIDRQIGLIFLVIAILIGLILFVFIKITSKKYLLVQKKLDDITTLSSDGLDGTRVIRAFNKQESELEKFYGHTKEYRKKVISVEALNSLLNPLTFAIINFAIILVIFFGGIKVDNSTLGTGEIIALINYLNQILIALIVVSNLVVIFTKGFASKRRIDEFLKLNDNNDSYTYDKLFINVGEPIIEFKNVGFSYENSTETLSIDNISFIIRKGMKVGIIGGTASGKTTIINLLEKFYVPTKGEILYKGVPIFEYNTFNLRDEIALVNQRTSLFKESIKNNLCMNNEYESNELEESLLNSCAKEFVMEKNNNIEFKVEEDGKNFSGGQKQRLSIARALLKDSEILILDDSYSSLDFYTEKKIKKNIEVLAKKKNLTLINISQRTSSIKDSDLILVMEHGELIASGNHDFLIENCPIYKEIDESQSKGGLC